MKKEKVYFVPYDDLPQYTHVVHTSHKYWSVSSWVSIGNPSAMVDVGKSTKSAFVLH